MVFKAFIFIETHAKNKYSFVAKLKNFQTKNKLSKRLKIAKQLLIHLPQLMMQENMIEKILRKLEWFN